MKRFVSMLLFLSVFFTMFASVGHAAEVVPKLYLNGQLLKSDVNPQIVNDYTMVPLAVLSDGMGYTYEWEHEAKRVTVFSGESSIVLSINDKTAIVNGEPVAMETMAQLVSNRTMVPLSFIGTQFGLDFEWKHLEKEVHMYEKPKEPEAPAEPTGWIKQVSFDGVSGLTIGYEGTLKADKPFYLENPRRIVIDFPNTAYTEEIMSQLVGEIKTAVEQNPLLASYRYSLFEPTKARVVIDVSEGIGFVMTENVGELRLDLMPAEEVPVDPGEPQEPPVTEPETPTGPEVYDIVIDAGHGGKDPGAYSVQKRYEKEFNLSVALKIKALLDKETQLKGHLTRSDDTFIELIDRVKFAENLKADLFVSIHANAIDKSSVTGTETYYSRAASKPFADVMHKHLLVGTGLKDRKVKQANYKVIKETTMPAVLLEAGYLTNQTDSKALFSDAVQNRIASEVVKGIKEYLEIK
ncbi:N-acetylmuramoyl-L-alanine amidase family protein [Paenibacillus arenilitoris]|uniref:N-acetylmuramoyl-L-alanine amidase n=1 Tax=Paenibacillus arenilitoris TaxID=2772299 RepID=A0A927H7L8_9BACL|nr:N-acetylmuramoyl-L-alanine amidase family protein [Paenibacillus arenilitoris]MBD2869719.1 N-acetylmuramoyl-L-alanine amidase [Paenibacillus arenilitoris]